MGIMGSAINAYTASYELPATLSYYGTIVQESGIPFPAANYVTTNPINDGAFIWVPVGSKVMFKDSSEGSPTAYYWTVPGGTIDDAAAKDVIVTYSTAGTYDFPTLKVSYASGDETFKYDLKIKVGGRAELCHSDTREWAVTYALGYAPFSPDNNGKSNGVLGGSNKLEVAGVGNFYRFSSPDMYVDGVNIYTQHKPTSFADEAKVKVRLYLPYIGESSFSMIGQFGTLGCIEGGDIPMADCKTSEDGAYVPVTDSGVYRFDISNPLSCEGYPYLFFAVEGFAYEHISGDLTEDFVLLTDVMPGRGLSSSEYNNALAHNSYVRTANETDYIRPVSVFGGMSYDFASSTYKSYNFWICPLVRGAETPYSGIDAIAADNGAKELEIVRSGGLLTVANAVDGRIEIFGLDGACKLSAVAANGGAIFNVSGLTSGLYVVRAADGAVAKFIK